MVTRSLPSLVGLALNFESGTAPEWIQLTPPGHLIRGRDGREWRMPDPHAVVGRFDPAKEPQIDLEHSSQLLAPNGMPAPAVGWIKQIEVRDGAIWGRVEWNADGAAAVIVGTAPDAQAATFPANTPVLVTGPCHAALLGASGTLQDAYGAAYAQGVNAVVVVRVVEGADPAETLAAVVGEETALSGIWALLTAQNVTGQTPRILCAPVGFFMNPADLAAAADQVKLN